MIHRILFIALFSVPWFSYAQEGDFSASGIVKSKEGPLPGATVQLPALGIGTVTDANGKFLIEKIPQGEYSVEIRSVGFKATVLDIIINKDLEIEFELEESTLGLESVVVTGTMQPVFVSQSPVKVEVITSDYIKTYLPTASASIMEGITLLNGVQEVVACGVCFTNSISINGLPGPYTAILMDGTPIYGNLAAVYGLNGIPSMIIDRIEVIKGPNSTLYGSEAVAGVINIITKDPKEQPLFSVDVMGTSHLESFGNISLAPKVGKSSGFIGLNYAYINDYDDRNDDGFGDMINLDRVSLFTKWDINRKSKRKFTVAAKYYYEDRRNGVEEYVRKRNYRQLRGSDKIYGESIYTNRAELFGEYQILSNLKVNYSLSHHDQDSYYGADYYEASQDIGFTNFVWDKQLSKHNLLGGATLRLQNYDDNTVATADSVDGLLVNRPDKQFIPGVFLQDEWEVNKKLSLLSGVRLDHYTRHGFIFSPRLSTKYKPEEWTTFRVNLGTGFRVVNLFAEDHAFITGQRSVVIEEDLKPEESYNIAFNFNHVYTLGISQGMVDIDAYYTYFTNKIIPDYETAGKIIYSNTDGYAVTKGVTLNVTQEFTFPLSLNVGVNFQQATETEETTRPIEYAPEWSGVIAANYNWKKAGAVFAYTMKFTGPMGLPEVYDLNELGQPVGEPRPITSSSFAIHNFQVSKQVKENLSLYGGVQNIFGYIQEASPLIGFNDPNANPGFSDHFDTTYAYSPIHGREFYLGVQWSLL